MLIEEITPDQIESVSRKFNALIRKSKSTDSSNEAENCVAVAQRILWEANLTEAQILSEDELKRRAKPTFIKDGVEIGPNKYTADWKFNSREWKSELLEVLSQSFFCRLHEAYAIVVTVVGEPKNVQMVKDLYVYLEKQIRAVRKEAFNQAVANGEIPYASQNRRSWYNGKPRALKQFEVSRFKDSYAKGCVASLKKRLEAQQRENIQEADKEYNKQQALNPGANLNDVTHSFGNALVVQITSELDEAYYEFFPEEHPAAVALAKYQRQIEYNNRMAELEKKRKEREARIEAGLEEPDKPAEPVKEYKKRGRKRMWRNTENYSAFQRGKVAGESLQINRAIKGEQAKLNK